MQKTIEKRGFHIELRAAQDGSASNTITGYIAIYNQLSEDLGGYKEMIAPGCFDAALSSDIPCLINHDQVIVGRTTSGTLILRSDDKGLAFSCDLPDTQPARDLKESVQRGDLKGCSFGFICLDETWADTGDTLVRTIRQVELVEVSVGVIWPAYQATNSSVRSLPASMPLEYRSLIESRAATSCPCGCPQCAVGSCGICSAAPQCAGAMRTLSLRNKMQMQIALASL